MRGLILLCATMSMLFNVAAQNCDTNLFPNGQQYYDTYHHVAADLENWQHYNTHDPTVNKQGEWYYMYSTDASWAGLNDNGALKRRSKDLVNWEFLGNAFDGVPQSAVDYFKIHNPSYTDQGIWAPFLFKYKGKYILYYSAPGGLDGVNYAFLGYATSDSAGGPWEDQGVITTSYNDNINAIDPTVVFDSVTQKLWMAYGSWHSGLYMLELDTATGGLKTPGDRGSLVARRQTSAYGLEGPELCYRNGWYYLFVSYDPLGDKYNIRVGRSKNPEGPYYDFNGVDMAEASSNIPMIQTPYRFKDHPGWQGTAHCGVYNDDGTYYIFNQGRPSIEPAMMVLHVRKIFWMNDWPVISPERYAGVPQCSIDADSLVGTWEHLPLIYKSSGAYRSTSSYLDISSDGTFKGDPANTWTFDNDTLVLNWSNGDIQKLLVFWGWDWENNCKTILYTGMDTTGVCIWGKKINQTEVDRYTKLMQGATYKIRNLHSHMLMHVPNNNDNPGASVKQGTDNELSSQLWKIKKTGDGYFYLFPHHSQNNLVMEVWNGTATSGNDIIVNTIDGTDRQRFKLFYLGNGYFRMMTKVSNDASCVDVAGFSVAEGANIFQWEYLGGLNQMWRFERIDSIALDTISVDTFDYLGAEPPEIASIEIFPNPSHDGRITVDMSSLNNRGDINISVFDLKGVIIYSKEFRKPALEKYEMELPRGIYVIRINSGMEQFLKKIVIQ